jgi:hypothetical protein
MHVRLRVVIVEELVKVVMIAILSQMMDAILPVKLNQDILVLVEALHKEMFVLKHVGMVRIMEHINVMMVMLLVVMDVVLHVK